MKKKNMKKLCVLTTALVAALLATLVLAGCGNPTGDDDDDSKGNDNSDVIGTWKNSDNSVTLELGNATWTLVKGSASANGSWTRNSNILTFAPSGHYSYATVGTATLSEGKLLVNIDDDYGSLPTSLNGMYTLSKSGSTGGDTGNATLKINNQSFTELTDVIWQNVSFADSQYENSIKTGNNVSKSVTADAGYIYFKRKSNAITARTKDLVIVNKGETKEFTFTDNTLIVEANNPDNAGTLGSLVSTVIWWDDAEGDMQPYEEAASFVGYYKTYSDLNGSSSSYYYNFNPPKNGQKSIAVGGTTTAKLHLRINLTKAAQLSFWYANKKNGTAGTTFSINGTLERTWTTDINWSKLIYNLAAGQNDLVWEKKDGSTSSTYYYLTLDDILIYYTE